MTTIDNARALLADASRIEVFTGAGMSADSGLVTYRDAQTGLWENVDPQAMASIDAWHTDPDTMLAWYLWRAQLAQRAEPNAGHLAIAQSPKTTVTTQKHRQSSRACWQRQCRPPARLALRVSLFALRRALHRPNPTARGACPDDHSAPVPVMWRAGASRRGVVRRDVAPS